MDRGKLWAAGLVALTTTGLCSTDSRAEPLGEEGESCQKRADCAPPLRCIDNRCVPPKDRAPKPPPPADEPAVDAGRCKSHDDCAADEHCDDGSCKPGEPGWADFELEGAHPFFGLSIGPAASGTWLFRAEQFDVDPAFFFAFRGGALFDRVELAVEVAPMTWIPRFDQESNMSFLVSIGGLPEIGDQVYWPLRFGIGLSAVNTYNDQTLMQGRLDLLGVAFQYGHLLFEVSLPSVRFHSEFDQYGLWGWLFNISGAYVI